MTSMKVDGHPKLVKESNSGIIQSTDTDAYKMFVSTRDVITKERRKNTYQEERLARQEEKLASLDQSIEDLKALMNDMISLMGVNNAKSNW